MKALVCLFCMDIRALEPTGLRITCRCGNVTARWLDPEKGTVKVRAKEQELARILSLNNRYLISGGKGPTHEETVEAGGPWEWWRQLHDKATSAPGYIFDKSKRACWATLIKVGETNDVTWEES